MMLTIPHGYQNAAPGTMPSTGEVTAMLKGDQELRQAGVLLTLEGLRPSSMARYVRRR